MRGHPYSARSITDVLKGSIIASARRAARALSCSMAAIPAAASSPSGGVRSHSWSNPMANSSVLETTSERLPNVWQGKHRPVARSVEIESAGRTASPPMRRPRSPSHLNHGLPLAWYTRWRGESAKSKLFSSPKSRHCGRALGERGHGHGQKAPNKRSCRPAVPKRTLRRDLYGRSTVSEACVQVLLLCGHQYTRL